jgi:hypothetical protein
LRVEFRQFNYVGDVQWLGGRVTAKRIVELGDGIDHPAVDLELWARNQRGVMTTPASATVLLPSREHGPVRLPRPVGGADTLEGALDASVERFGRR